MVALLLAPSQLSLPVYRVMHPDPATASLHRSPASTTPTTTHPIGRVVLVHSSVSVQPFKEHGGFPVGRSGTRPGPCNTAPAIAERHRCQLPLVLPRQVLQLSGHVGMGCGCGGVAVGVLLLV